MTDTTNIPQSQASSHRVMLRGDVLVWLREQAELEEETLSYILNRTLLGVMREGVDLDRL